MDIRFPFSPAEIAKVRMVQFGILSPEEIVKFSFLKYVSSSILIYLIAGKIN